VVLPSDGDRRRPDSSSRRSWRTGRTRSAREIGIERRAQGKSAKARSLLYGPRQQFAIAYGEDLADEPLPISYIASGRRRSQARLVGTQCWLQQGKKVELAIVEDDADWGGARAPSLDGSLPGHDKNG